MLLGKSTELDREYVCQPVNRSPFLIKAQHRNPSATPDSSLFPLLSPTVGLNNLTTRQVRVLARSLATLVSWNLTTSSTNVTGLFCNTSIDGIGTCWPRTSAGEMVSRPCPEYFYGVRYNTTNNVYRECLSNGTWAMKGNYSQCQAILNEELCPLRVGVSVSAQSGFPARTRKPSESVTSHSESDDDVSLPHKASRLPLMCC
ncbi:corticotropin-releasing factor receptor 1 isoform X1 [Arapaima gigas]